MAERVWSEKDLARRANRRLAVLRHAEEVSGNVAATCRYYGISRNVFYRWKLGQGRCAHAAPAAGCSSDDSGGRPSSSRPRLIISGGGRPP